MFTKAYSRLVVLGFCVMLTGCATSRSEIKLHSPTIVAPATTATSKQRAVVIGTITDERVFEQAPTDPSTPSLGFGGADKATDDVKARAIGRKRNTYGMALGDVLLQPGQTVEGVVRENLVAAFEQAGYQVKGAGDAGASPLVVDVHIKKFWAWFDPGFWAITLNDNIATDLVIHGAGSPVVVSTHVEEKRQVATEDAWMQIVDKGLDAYRAEVSHRMQASGGSDIPKAAVSTVPASPAPVAPASSPAAAASAVVATSTAAPKPMPVAEARPKAVTPSPSPSAPPITVAAGPASVTGTSSQDSAANAAIAPLAQSVATQMGCGAVQANGAATFIAPCDTYGVLIDCDGGQCRPMHTVNVKHDE